MGVLCARPTTLLPVTEQASGEAYTTLPLRARGQRRQLVARAGTRPATAAARDITGLKKRLHSGAEYRWIKARKRRQNTTFLSFLSFLPDQVLFEDRLHCVRLLGIGLELEKLGHHLQGVVLHAKNVRVR